jgi:hypothetical protein
MSHISIENPTLIVDGTNYEFVQKFARSEASRLNHKYQTDDTALFRDFDYYRARIMAWLWGRATE